MPSVQDMTSLNYSTHPATENLGPIGSRPDGIIGLHLHDTMAFDLDSTPRDYLMCSVGRETPRISVKWNAGMRCPLSKRKATNG